MPCVPLTTILQLANITHVNFFMLDVEGAELDVLKSTDWSRVTFDVIAVETEPDATASYRPATYKHDVVEFLELHGYIFEFDMGRNSWFRHPEFKGDTCGQPSIIYEPPTAPPRTPFGFIEFVVMAGVAACVWCYWGACMQQCN